VKSFTAGSNTKLLLLFRVNRRFFGQKLGYSQLFCNLIQYWFITFHISSFIYHFVWKFGSKNRYNVPTVVVTYKPSWTFRRTSVIIVLIGFLFVNYLFMIIARTRPICFRNYVLIRCRRQSSIHQISSRLLLFLYALVRTVCYRITLYVLVVACGSPSNCIITVLLVRTPFRAIVCFASY